MWKWHIPSEDEDENMMNIHAGLCMVVSQSAGFKSQQA